MPDDDGLIAAHYRIDQSRPGPKLQGGFRAFTVIDKRDPALHLIAVETRPELPARPRISLARSGPPVPNTVLPIEYGWGRDLAGKAGWYVISDGVPGNPIGLGRQETGRQETGRQETGRQGWRESDLMTLVLQPAASALAALQARGLTHRAINPDNLFRTGPREPVMLGPFWAAPPASLQPAVFEPPYMALCLPNGRGDGAIADDVYALGVTLLALAIGHMPLPDLDDMALLRRKMELGSYEALTAGATLPALISDLLRGMLAEDPEHRPSPALLLKPEQARARRVAARPPRRAQQALNLGGLPVWSARELALALSVRPERGYAMLKNSEVERWLRRFLGDPALAMRVEDITRKAADSGPEELGAQGGLVMRSIAVIDPLAPLVWRGVAVQPDGVGPALVAAPPEVVAALQEVVLSEGVGQFLTINVRRAYAPGLRDEQREWRVWLATKGLAGGLKRLTYGMNPMLACASPLLAGRPVVRVADLLPALDSAAPDADRSRPPIDAHVAAFLAARLDTGLAAGLVQLSSLATQDDRLTILRLYGQLQERLNLEPLPGLAGWLISSGFAAVDDWRNNSVRASRQQQALDAAKVGQIAKLLDVVDDEGARDLDAAGMDAAGAQVRVLEQMLADIAEGAAGRARAAELLGNEIVTGGGLMASLGAALALALQ